MIDSGPVVLGRKTGAREGATFDGYSVIFFISAAGKRVRCAVSLAALEFLAQDRQRDRTRVLANFALHQDRITQIAETLFQRRPDSVSETLWIWENDAEDGGAAPAEACDAPLPGVGETTVPLPL